MTRERAIELLADAIQGVGEAGSREAARGEAERRLLDAISLIRYQVERIARSPLRPEKEAMERAFWEADLYRGMMDPTTARLVRTAGLTRRDIQALVGPPSWRRR